MREYILALDQGTTSSRAIIFNHKGEIVKTSQREFKQIYPKAGYVEHDAIDILYSELISMANVFQESNITPDQIAAIGVTNQRETTVLWDKRTGIPVYNAIVWQCRRTASMVEELKAQGLTDMIKEKTGLVLDAYFSATKIKWILDNVPKAKKLADEGNLLFGNIDTWLIWNFSGGSVSDEAVHVTDYSNACRTMLFNTKELCWDKEICDTLGIPMSILPEVRPSSEVYGKFTRNIIGLESLEGVPIASAIGDQPAALFGQACFDEAMAKNTYGTGAFLLMNTGENRVASKNDLTSGIAWAIGDKITYCLEGSAFNAGSTIKWLRDEVHLIDNTAECDKYAEEVEDSNGCFLVPAFTGLGAPYWDMYARGCIMGLTRGVNRSHIMRAARECIAFQVKDLYLAMKEDSGKEIKELRVDGGASASDLLLQIQADFINADVNRPEVVETTALGCAYLAGLAVGFWKDLDEIRTLRKCNKIFKPKMETEKRDELYRGWKKAVSRAMNWENCDE